jgi:hypothetical protein
MTYADNLKALRDEIMESLLREAENPKPSYSVHGQNLDWNGYRRSVMEQLDALDRKIAQQAPFEVVSRGA